MEIYKFGGLSIENAGSVQKVCNIIRNNTQKELVVVFSAMGKMTRLLGRIAEDFYNNQSAGLGDLNAFTAYHEKIMQDLDLDEDESKAVHELLSEFEYKLLHTQRESFAFYYDQIVCYGELISSRILSIYLNKTGVKNRWLDVRRMIKADNSYREGRIDWEKTPALIREKINQLEPGEIALTQGFIAGSREGFSITLGFEGSDYTGAVLANSLDAKKLIIWKDVDGIMNCDPKAFENAQKIDRISFQDAAGLSFMGAKVIHPATIKPLQAKNIPLEVRSYLKENNGGTMVGDFPANTGQPVFAILRNLLLFELRRPDHAFIGSYLPELLSIFRQEGIAFRFVHQNALEILFVADKNDEKTNRLKNSLNNEFLLKTTEVEMIGIKYPDEDTCNILSKGREVIVESRSKDHRTLIVKA